MAYSLNQVRALLTAPELALFEHSRASALKLLSPARLRQKVTRARALRDKYSDLYRRQTAQTRRVRGAQPTDNERTGRKAEVFGEVLVRFERRLEAIEASAQRAAPKESKQASRRTAKGGPESLTDAVRKALEAKRAAAPAAAQGSARPDPSAMPPAVQMSTAPTDMPAAAQRLNPLKAAPINRKIHASAQARNQRAQARRDGR